MKKIFTLILALLMAAEFSGIGSLSARADVFDNNYESLSGKQETPLPASLSPIEEMFNGRDTKADGTYLRQVGYGVFAPGGGGSSPSGKFGGNYKLSIGEKVNIYLSGDSVDIMALSGSSLLSPVSKTTVDSKGNLFIQGIGLIPAENRTLSEVENSVNAAAARKYKSIRAHLTVASGTEFTVFVYGQVGRPGKVSVGNNSSILDVLSAAGGVKKTGTLRNISYYSSSGTQKIDLYKALFSGNDGGIIVRPNDKIFVDRIGDVIALKNGVATPGIYEVKKGESLQSVIPYAGGFLPETKPGEIMMTTLDKDKSERVAKNISWNSIKKLPIKSGDAFEFKLLYNVAENTVVLQGNIKHPATYAYKNGMRLSDILKNRSELLEETFINQAVIRRISGPERTVETIPVFLKEFFAGMNDPLLKPGDVITVHKSTNAGFVDVYGCIDTPRQITFKPGMTLNDVMTDVKFLESSPKDANEMPAAYKGSVEKSRPAIIAGTQNSANLVPAENVAVEITGGGKTRLYYLYDILINSDRVKSIKLSANDKVFFRVLRKNEILKSVKITGFVKVPGVYSFVQGKKLTDIIEMAGGLSDEADLRGIVFKRSNLRNKQAQIAAKNSERDIQLLEGRLASGYKQTENDQQTKIEMISMLRGEKNAIADRYDGQIALHISSNDISKISERDNLEIQDGDDIYIPKLSTYVSVIGEVYNEQSFVYIKGSNVKDYIRSVGGYTPNANKFRTYKVGVNGRAQKVGKHAKVEPGDIIVVPRKIAGNDWITPICSTLQGIASIFLIAFGINKW